MEMTEAQLERYNEATVRRLEVFADRTLRTKQDIADALEENKHLLFAIQVKRLRKWLRKGIAQGRSSG